MSASKNNPFYLLRERRFAPFFVTQFLGCFNDNLYKNALIMLFAFQASQGRLEDSHTLINLCAGLLILPFILFSGYAGQISDKFGKAGLIRIIKFAEIAIVAFAGLAFYLNNTFMLIMILFLLGTQSAFFCPIKYSILPEHLAPSELMKGNGLLEMGTFTAILLGTVAGTIFMGFDKGAVYVSLGVMVIAVFGWLASFRIPKRPAVNPSLKFEWNPFYETWSIMKMATHSETVFLSIIAISWYWFFSSVLLAQVPAYTLYYLGSSEEMVTILLVGFALCIGIGSVMSDWVSGGLSELGVLPLSLFAMAFVTIDLANLFVDQTAVSLTLREALSLPKYWRMFFDVGAMGFFGGLYLVPLYTLIQRKTKAEERARIVAANNIVGSVAMVGASVVAIWALNTGWTIPQLYLFCGIVTGFLGIYIFYTVPDYIFRLIVWSFIALFYRVKKTGFENIPKSGPAIVVCNHVSYVDPFVVMGMSKRPMRFVAYYVYEKLPIVGFLLRAAKTIPVAERTECAETRSKAFDEIIKALENGDLVCIFPEGKLTRDGELCPLKPGILKILQEKPVPVIPMAVQGLWGSIFSYRYGKALCHIPRNWFKNRIGIACGAPIPPERFDLTTCAKAIEALRGENR